MRSWLRASRVEAVSRRLDNENGQMRRAFPCPRRQQPFRQSTPGLHAAAADFLRKVWCLLRQETERKGPLGLFWEGRGESGRGWTAINPRERVWRTRTRTPMADMADMAENSRDGFVCRATGDDRCCDKRFSAGKRARDALTLP